MKIAIVHSDYYPEITKGLVSGVYNEAKSCDVSFEEFVVFGVMEIPLKVMRLMKSQRFDAVIALGCVIKGETGHYDVIQNTVPSCLMSLSLEFDVPIAHGILFVNNIDQAFARCSDDRNKGGEAFRAIESLL